MKKLLLLLGAAAAFGATAANPVIMQNQRYDVSLIISDFTASRQNLLAVIQGSNGTSDDVPTGFKVYNGNLEKIADILFPASKTETCTYYRQWNDDYVEEFTQTWPTTSPAGIYYQKDGIEYDESYLTQTLFNKDSQLEYVLANSKKVETTVQNGSDKTWGETMVTTGFTVMSQNDSKVLDITLPNGYYADDNDLIIMPIEGKVYVVIDATDSASGFFYDPSANYYTLFFELDSAGGVKAPKIVEGRMKVTPAAPRHGETVSVDLGSEAEGATLVNVVSANGSTVRSVPVSAGQRNVSLQTAGLTSGLYVVTANGREAAKIIIR